MNIKSLASTVICLMTINFIFLFPQENKPLKVELKKDNQAFKLYRDGKPYKIKGAGCEFGNIDLLAKNGGNTFRTWRVDNGKETGEQVLQQAQKLNLAVVMGIEVSRQRHGFDYDDALAVANQKEEIRKQVLRLKDYPSLLVWGIGNELNLRATNLKVWNAVDEIAIMIHELDPNHPVTTMLAGLDKTLIDQIKERCPHLDFISIQMYGDLINLQQRIKDSGYDGPYMVTEWGATGHWEVGQTSWKAPMEQNSSEKASSIKERYDKAIAIDSTRCIGNFIFVWEQKQERTPTWYGLFSENGEQTEAIDIMYKIWNGHWPKNRCPSVKFPNINGKIAKDNIEVKPEEKMIGNIEANDPDNDTLTYLWEIMPESTDLKDGGDKESRPETLTKISTKTGTVELKAPMKEGAYRLFIYVIDGHNHAGTANIPFFVKN